MPSHFGTIYYRILTISVIISTVISMKPVPAPKTKSKRSDSGLVSGKKPLGRKRDQSRDAEIIEVALSVLSEIGYDGMTMDLVAAKAKAGKGAIYRRWSSKENLVLDIVAHLKQQQIDTRDLPDTGTLRGDLLALFKTESPDTTERKLKVIAALSAMLANHPHLSEAANQVMVEPWVEVYTILMKRARKRGEISKISDIETLSQIVPSMAAYRALILRKPFDQKFLVSLIDGVLMPALGITIK